MFKFISYSDLLILSSVAIGLIYSYYQYLYVSKIQVRAIPRKVNEDSNKEGVRESTSKDDVKDDKQEELAETRTTSLQTIHQYISDGAHAFLYSEYEIMVLFLIVFGIFLLIVLGSSRTCGIPIFVDENGKLCDAGHIEVGCKWVHTEGSCWTQGILTTLAFVLGGITSIISGYIGMSIAVYSNVRTSVECQYSWNRGFGVAFRAGSVMGFALTSLALLVLYLTIKLFVLKYDYMAYHGAAEVLFECVSGYGLGGSSVALFGRVGGGIYTKAADVGADLVGKIEAGIPEDDPRNPAVIADNVGDNVGDIAGMGSDLFGSFAESTCAALVLASIIPELNQKFETLIFPLLLGAAGILVSYVTSLFAVSIPSLMVTKAPHIERNLKLQLIISTILMTPVAYYMSMNILPPQFCVNVLDKVVLIGSQPSLCSKYCTNFQAFICIAAGLWAGLIIGYYTEYMTSATYEPVQEVAESCATGAATNIIYGLALGYKSCVLPVIVLSLTIYFSFTYGHLYGIALSALGMLGTMCIELTIDAYGPISDNAGGIAEMSGLPSNVRRITDALDAAGNTTAAIGKGFAIGSASLVSLALFGAFVSKSGHIGVDVMQPLSFAGLLVGSMLPYWFSAMTMKSVGRAAKAMVEEVRRQFHEKPGIMDMTEKPDYELCVSISTKASLYEMIFPGMLVIFTPLIFGTLFGIESICGLLAGSLVSSVQMAISASNTGGAWDNAKKYLEAQGKKHSEAHKASVVGDTVGDPLKDTSGPSLNILMKLMAILSLVLCPFFIKMSAYNLSSY